MIASSKALVGATLAIALLAPISWQHGSPQGATFKLQFPVAVAPTANGTWGWSGDALTAAGSMTIGVVPNQPGRLTTITDVSVWTWSNASYAHALWWIRDGNTGQVLYSGALGDSKGPNAGAGRDSVHLSTPIVLDNGGSNPPTLEFGGILGTPMATTPSGFTCACSVLGRYTDFQ